MDTVLKLMTLLIYPALGALLLVGAKKMKKGEWNDTVMSLKESKAWLGFCAIMILLHHASQRNCAPWLEKQNIVHGMDVFVYVGYLMVAIFFFCSGYGMYTAHKEKEDFFKDYGWKRIFPVITPAVLMWVVFFIIERIKHIKIYSPVWINTYDYIWYIPAMLWLYLMFYISFKLIKNEKTGFLILGLGILFYILVCYFFSPGSWWFNNPHLFFLGALFAKNREKVLAFLKEKYAVMLIVSIVVTLVGFFVGNYSSGIFGDVLMKLNLLIMPLAVLSRCTIELAQMISACSMALLFLLIGMKVRVGNPVLGFLGGITLELYLVHPLFVQLFGFSFLGAEPLYYIPYPLIYVAVILICSLPVAFSLHTALHAIRKMMVS